MAVNNPTIDTYESLLLGYAAGLLDQAQSLIVASHIALSPEAKRKVQNCEALGGALMERYCEPVSMHRESLARCLDRLDNSVVEEREETYELVFPDGLSIPICLKRTLACQPTTIRWHTIRPGVQSYELHLECRRSHTHFLKAERGVEAPRFAPPRGLELTLILDGALADDTGVHKRGDLVIADEDCTAHHHACKNKGGFYMIVSSSPARTSGLQQLLHTLFRI